MTAKQRIVIRLIGQIILALWMIGAMIAGILALNVGAAGFSLVCLILLVIAGTITLAFWH